MAANKKIKVLVVDDSVFFRTTLERELAKAPNIEVVGTACDPYDARDKILSLEPDVLTLDVEMPRMDGIKFLTRLIPQYPIPVVVVSSANVSVFDAVNAGAVDFMAKPFPGEDMTEFITKLCMKINVAATATVKSGTPVTANVPSGQPVRHSDIAPSVRGGFSAAPSRVSMGVSNRKNLIALGASTGGTDALERVLLDLPADCPPIVIVQHMPPVFTKMYAERLDRNCKMKVKEAEDGDRLVRGLCLVAEGDKHMRLQRDSRGYFVSCAHGEKVSGHCPSVDVLFDSVAEVAGKDAVAAILTGMGADGARGMKKMRDRGAYTIGQNRETCVVYGMPMEAYEMGGVCEQQPLNRIGDAILRQCT